MLALCGVLKEGKLAPKARLRNPDSFSEGQKGTLGRGQMLETSKALTHMLVLRLYKIYKLREFKQIVHSASLPRNFNCTLSAYSVTVEGNAGGRLLQYMCLLTKAISS